MRKWYLPGLILGAKGSFSPALLILFLVLIAVMLAFVTVCWGKTGHPLPVRNAAEDCVCTARWRDGGGANRVVAKGDLVIVKPDLGIPAFGVVVHGAFYRERD
jgi:hypothetical protein